ncbi:hypothetical protein N4G70_34510 [Streptomyces sp. ASQP_92]|uniref:hypothetical protein n=1 Tax=Streptomyces sp. ASQP_92 TaxID=2979116 RepID=UPI0021C0BA58|nr:hypothetical protein [Streptomyces sp. ASQP_92]MCT9093933.1 hypothetical protein [Streptomyces sp. ASQP_92]
MTNYRLVWRERGSDLVRISAVSYGLSAAEYRQRELQAAEADVRIVEVPVGGAVPEDVLEGMRTGNTPAVS